MEEDITTLSQVLARSLYLRMAAVKSGSVYEHHPQDARRLRTHFSPETVNRRKQVGHLWSRSVHAFADRGVAYAPARLQAQWVLPYRRRMFIECGHPGLGRVNDILDRVRAGLLEALADEGFGAQFLTEEGRRVATDLVRALVSWNLPAVAIIADANGAVRAALRRSLGITDEELIEMVCLEGEGWDALADGDETFGTFYKKELRA